MEQILVVAVFLLSVATARATDQGVLGNWTTPNGSTVQIYRCDANVCARLIAISNAAPSRVDGKNPNAALRSRSLCGLTIGTKFHLATPDTAQGGQLYDPLSGNTYSGSMTSAGDKLKLRGYIGIPLFGRTETWTRAPGNIPACRP